MDINKPRYTPMSRRRRIYEGKAKVLFEGPEPGTLIQHFKDDATAFNAKKHEVIEGKGVLNNRISEYLFQRLNDIGVPTHFIRRLNMREQLIREVEIIPLEVVVRNVAAGSLSTRLGIDEGTAAKIIQSTCSPSSRGMGCPITGICQLRSLFNIKLSTRSNIIRTRFLILTFCIGQTLFIIF